MVCKGSGFILHLDQWQILRCQVGIGRLNCLKYGMVIFLINSKISLNLLNPQIKSSDFLKSPKSVDFTEIHGEILRFI